MQHVTVLRSTLIQPMVPHLAPGNRREVRSVHDLINVDVHLIRKHHELLTSLRHQSTWNTRSTFVCCRAASAAGASAALDEEASWSVLPDISFRMSSIRTSQSLPAVRSRLVSTGLLCRDAT